MSTTTTASSTARRTVRDNTGATVAPAPAPAATAAAPAQVPANATDALAVAIKAAVAQALAALPAGVLSNLVIQSQPATPAGMPGFVTKEGLTYVCVRTYSAGVFTGYLRSKNEIEVELIDARRIWYWDGASSLSELAMMGVARPDQCKFPMIVPYIVLTQAIEIIPMTQRAKDSIDSVKNWTQFPNG